MREQVRQARDAARADAGDPGRPPGEQDLGSDATRRVHEQTRRLREEAASARFSAGQQDSDLPPGGSAWAAWTDWPGRRGWDDRSRTRTRPGWSESLDFGTFRDLERLAVQFTSDLRKLAMQSSAVGENVITDLRAILEEALERIKAEIFRSGHEDPGGTGDLPRHD